MTVVKRYPHRDILELQDRMNRVFENSTQDRAKSPNTGEWVPCVDIYEDESGITIKAELPGVEKQDIHIAMSNGVLRITGKRCFTSESRRENYHMLERHYGTFQRSFDMPRIVDTGNIDARLENGMLKVCLPKQAGSVTRKIPVTGV
ncbi:MAG: Hsp20/alpha crystallin family protein [Thermodesulfobacteriota bacterium]|nr:Hsp20/alpha crystallin family protein [Thermodesulfobacteriota bacterium]